MAEDTPTHRMHILQGQLKQIVEWTNLLQARRAVIVERIVRATANNKVARALQVERALDRSIASMLRDLNNTNDKLNKIADKLNKCRGLLLEISDGEVLLEKTERLNGHATTSAPDRGGLEESATGPETDQRSVHDR